MHNTKYTPYVQATNNMKYAIRPTISKADMTEGLPGGFCFLLFDILEAFLMRRRIDHA